MGVMRFLVPRRDRLPADAPDRAYMAGLDEIPWQSRAHWTDDGLAIEAAISATAAISSFRARSKGTAS